MIETDAHKRAIQEAVRKGLTPLKVQVPINLVEWSEENFYLSAESSYVEQKWVTIPWQRGIMLAISNDDIRVVNWIKSARVGATKIMLAASFYFAHHKNRTQIFYQPNDKDAEEFCSAEVDTALRDVPCMREIFPDLGKQTKNNKNDKKQFLGSILYIKGGKAGTNYRRISADVIFYDELEGFDKDIQGEGSPLKLGDKRLEGSLFPKSVRMTTPKTKNGSLIEGAVKASDCLMRYYVPCPHCGEYQVLKWGGPDVPYGMKWDKDNPKSVHYCCEHHGCAIHNNDLPMMNEAGFWANDDLTVKMNNDGYFFDENNIAIPPPQNLSFHIWTAYSPFVQWSLLVSEFMSAQRVLREENDPTELKTFVNTTLGETWEDEQAERMDTDVLMDQREHYPEDGFDKKGLFIVGSFDMQDDRIEGKIKVYGKNKESWLLDVIVIYGNPTQPDMWDALERRVNKTYLREDGVELPVSRFTFDSGGHYTNEVYQFCNRIGLHRAIPTKGASTYGEPLYKFPKKTNEYGVYLVIIGTDTVKDIVYGRLRSTIEEVEEGTDRFGICHFPIADFCDRSYFDQLTSEVKVYKKHRGRMIQVYDNEGRRNEMLDTECGCVVAFEISLRHYGVNLDDLEHKQVKPLERTPSENALLETAKLLGAG